jgi:hypothetical protein
MLINNINHIGDVFAIPLFALLAVYLYQIENKTPVEYILLAFAIVGFIADIIFTVLFLRNKK